MKFKLNRPDLIKAFEVVSIVTPRPVTPQGGAGYLFVVRGERCYLYSRDAMCVARAEFPISEVEGEGAFVYPAEFIDPFRYVNGDAIAFETSKEDDDKFLVKWQADSGESQERLTFDPDLLSTCDKELEKATTAHEFPSAILREAINQGRPFLAQPKDTRAEEQHKGLIVFDQSKPDWAKGDGYLFASNSIQAFYFHCDAFVGKHFEVHGQYLPSLTAFLSKSEGTVTFRRGDNYTFVLNSEGHVFGWPKQAKVHGKFAYYALKSEQYVFVVPKTRIVNALKYTRTSLDKSRDKIKVQYDHATSKLTFTVADGSVKARGSDIQVEVTQAEKDQTWNVNIDHFMQLVEGVKGNNVVLRVVVATRGEKEIAMFRTIDEFRMTPDGKVVVETEGTHVCRVTRFMPSKD